MKQSAAEILIECLRKCGVVAAGVARCESVAQREIASLKSWLDGGFNAGMQYMGNHIDIRRDPSLLLEGAKSIISVAFPYAPSGREKKLPHIAGYALGPDYHDQLRERLSGTVNVLHEVFGGDCRICVDSAPIFERYWAEICGVGSRCDNGLIAVAGYGTRVLLAEILTTVDIPEIEGMAEGRIDLDGVTAKNNREGDDKENNEFDECLHCGACQRACPAGALQRDSRVDSRLCLSYLTIEHRGEWDETGREAMSTPAGRNTLFGCDICQDVCPLNRRQETGDRRQETGDRRQEAGGRGQETGERGQLEFLRELTAEEVMEMSQEQFSRAFKGMPIKRAKLAGLQRNARNILGIPWK